MNILKKISLSIPVGLDMFTGMQSTKRGQTSTPTASHPLPPPSVDTSSDLVRREKAELMRVLKKVLQRVTARCRVLPCVVLCCRVLLQVSRKPSGCVFLQKCCGELQRVAVRCRLLQNVAASLEKAELMCVLKKMLQ